MGIREAWAALRGTVPWEYVEYETPEFVLGLTPADLWRTQPHLRTVVSFLARNIAQLGLHVFERVSDTDRRRLRDEPIARLIAQPNSHATTYELVYGLVGDLALFGEAFWWVTPDADRVSGWSVEKLSPAWVTARGGSSIFTIDWVDFVNPKTGATKRVTVDDGLVWFPEWNPGTDRSVSSPVDALRDILAEQISARRFRNQMWRRGGRFGGYLTRPQGARWDKDTREKFQRQWKARYSGDTGVEAGGTPILEDGMEYKTNRFSAREEEWLEGTKLSLAQVASVYQVNPTMVGLLDNANFSNVHEFRKMLYTDTLGPILTMVQDRINTFVVPKVTDAAVYVEFNVAEKLKGSFEEQASALQSMVGRPIMTADEGRGRLNLPAMGGDAAQLVTPLNVLIGGQASPTDSGTQNENAGSASIKSRVTVGGGTVSVKSGASETQQDAVQVVLKRFFKHQRQVILSKLGSKDDGDWWDADRWNAELADDLYRIAVQVSSDIGRDTAKQLGFSEDDYDVDRTLAFLRAVAEKRSEWINDATRRQIAAALAEQSIPESDGVSSVFNVAEEQRSGAGAGAIAAFLAGWATNETVGQLVSPGVKVMKTWDTGKNPRPSHAALNGQTVLRNQPFSNGAMYPGDAVLDAGEIANCNCGLTLSW